MEISRSRNRLKYFFFIFLSSCHFSDEATKNIYLEKKNLVDLDNILNIEMYEAYVRTCETLITKNNLEKANEKTVN